MLANETAVYNSYEVCLFPLPYLNCSQPPYGTYSHCCDYASDWTGPNASNNPYYAPFSGYVMDIGGDSQYGNYIVFYKNSNPVWTPDGLKQDVICVFMHDENLPQIGDTFNQGDLLGHTGSAGPVTGDHVHLDQCFQSSWNIESGVSCSGGGSCYALTGSVSPAKAYYLTGNETVNYAGGIQFDTYSGGGGLSGSNLWFILGLAVGRKKGGR